MIPKLELKTALYSVRLRQLIAEDLGIQLQAVIHKSDAMIVLQKFHFLTVETTVVSDQSSLRNTESVHGEKIATREGHNEPSRRWHNRGHCVTVATKWKTEWASPGKNREPIASWTKKTTGSLKFCSDD